MAKITVTAGAGRTVPIPQALGRAPNGGLLLLRNRDERQGDEVGEMQLDDGLTFVTRSLRNGDLVRVTAAKKEPTP